MFVTYEKAKCVCFIYMQRQKVAFTYVQINMNRPRYIENSTCDPLKYEMGSPIIIVSIFMGKFIRTKG